MRLSVTLPTVEPVKPAVATWLSSKSMCASPVLFARMCGLTEARSLEGVDISRLAATVAADRGTVLKQMKRYLERE